MSGGEEGIKKGKEKVMVRGNDRKIFELQKKSK